MRNRPLQLFLPDEEYRQLDALARSEERDVFQQARYIIRRALANHDHHDLVTAIANRGNDDRPGS